MKNKRFVTFLCFAIFSLLLKADDGLRKQINQIYNNGGKEQQMLMLLKTDSTPEQTGTVYAAIARMYSRHPMISAKKVMQYAQEALKNNPDVLDVCEMYVCLGEANRKICKNNPNRKVEDVQKLVIPYVKGLSFVLDNLRTDTELPLPCIERFDVPNGHPQRAKFIERHARQVAARAEAEQQNQLLSYRNAFCHYIFEHYDPLSIDAPTFSLIMHNTLQDAEKEKKTFRVLKNAAEAEKKRVSHRIPIMSY